jgi:hypothetical protein
MATDIIELLTAFYDSFATGDPSAWTDNLADDVIGIGTDPDEFWEGAATVAKVGAEQVQQMSAAGMKLQPGKARTFTAGEVSWVVDTPTVQLPDGSTLPTRLSLIASRDNGALRIRHFHLSAAVSNEQALGQELPTT